MKKSERMVLFYDLVPLASSRTFDAPAPLSVRRVIKLLEMVPKDLRVLRRAKGANTIYLNDIEVTGKFAKILINKSDKRIPDPVFTDPSKKARRRVGKHADEGQDFSAHVVIRFPDDDAYPALMLVEQVAGISISVVVDLLRKTLKAARFVSPGDFLQVHPDGSIDSKGAPKQYRVTHSVEAEGHPSDTFTSDLNAGEVQYVELTSRRHKGGFDTTGYFVEDREMIVLKPSISIKRPQNLTKHVMSVVTGKKKDYTKARIKFKLANGEPRHVDVDLDDELPEKYVKRMMIGSFAADLESSYDNLHPELVNKMVYLASRS